MTNYIDDIFGPQGIMSKSFKGFESRVGQVIFAKAVDKVIEEKRHLIAEAPCGIGKSLSYCVPAVFHAIQNNKKIVIATANIALQEQLYTKDLPTLQNILPWPFKHALIKGRNNYLCVSKWQDEQITSSLKNRKSKKDRSQYRAILSWARKTKTGDLSELDFTPFSTIWHIFSSSSDECKGHDCKCYGDCFTEKAKEKASDAHIFVTNYHLLFAHLQVRMATGKDLILPDFDVAICDEAHKAADIARDFFGFRISEGSIRFASRLLGRLQMQEEFDLLELQMSEFFYSLKKLYKSNNYHIRFKSPPDIDWQPLVETISGIKSSFLSAAFKINDPNQKDEKAALWRAAGTAERLMVNIEKAMTFSDQDMVYYIEENQNESISLVGKPVSVAPILTSELFSKTGSVISTSATLAVDGGFSHIVDELGVIDPLTLIVDSPFDFNKQAILVIPEEIHEPTDPLFSKDVAEIVKQIILLADGRVLGLFTSYRNLETAWAKAMEIDKYKILKQGDKPRTALIEEFRSDIHSVLLGTESFWTGVDVPGEALSCVIIDRLPFQTPDDPVLNAISERNENWFMSYSVPKAVIAFKQGFGRLIRRTSDKGVIVVLDRRIITKPYGRKFLYSIPDVRRSKRLESIKTFLELLT